MGLVASIADTITVLQRGATLAKGTGNAVIKAGERAGSS